MPLFFLFLIIIILCFLLPLFITDNSTSSFSSSSSSSSSSKCSSFIQTASVFSFSIIEHHIYRLQKWWWFWKSSQKGWQKKINDKKSEYNLKIRKRNIFWYITINLLYLVNLSNYWHTLARTLLTLACMTDEENEI